MKTKPSKEGYRITPKGWLTVRTNSSVEEMEKFWEEFTAFVASQAKQDEWPDGVPCLIMEGGGFCITVQKEQTPNTQDDEHAA